jgi:hypothetical protein
MIAVRFLTAWYTFSSCGNIVASKVADRAPVGDQQQGWPAAQTCDAKRGAA